ncbi:hypothetical protein BGW36DRAFT_429752 [Talaromyces proteolyticus]|uniref:Uncharacterized protein n=1 Tax=Talaromyces proteolyticus TaxID=1131652 RepID=A0AAD4KKQ5_9EURO|nr:uncharacterized protein BGW36DRAFT_429752 [Talaromyces proteolyticus]KAH8693718.1 hypothetical protein BGW36DRAFT_429752 [Talaromyces proteolyticus]
MPYEEITNFYPDKGSSISSSIPSSKCAENAFTCTRPRCHCDAANREDPDATETVSLENRRHADYFYRPPVLGPLPGFCDSQNSPYADFHYEKLSKAEYCEQCQFCSVLSRWCGRPSALDLNCASVVDLNYTKMKLPNATWVQEPLIVNPAEIYGENTNPREPFLPAVFSHTISYPFPQELPVYDVDLSRDEWNRSMESIHNIHRCRTMPQRRAEKCQRLRLCKDVRGAKREDWAFEEGSLVIGIHPNFVDLPQQLIAPDEFELRYGEVYVVCRMFPDLWALCARLRMSECILPNRKSDTVGHGVENIKFLPLCAVTLAANFANFDRRYAEYRLRYPYATAFPYGGLRITPPMRQESIEASEEFFEFGYESLHMAGIVFDLCQPRATLPSNTDYAPLNLSIWEKIQELIPFSDAFGKSGTLRRGWRKSIPKETNQSATGSKNASDCPQDLSPNVSLENDIIYTEDKSVTHREEIDTVKANGRSRSLRSRRPVSKRKSVREFFFGTWRQRPLELLDTGNPVEEASQGNSS